MYAVIETGGKQYRVQEGTKLRVEKLQGEPGDAIKLDKVLMVGAGSDVQVGDPYLKGAEVSCEVLSQIRDKKIIVFRTWRRKDNKKKQGHRQQLTTLEVKSIKA